MFGIEKKDANGKKVDYTTDEAAVTNSTAVMLTSVANINNGSYKISRPFNIAVKEGLSPVAQKTNEEIRNYGHSAGHDWEDMMDAVMFHEDICDGSCSIFEEDEFHPETLNPYEMEIMDMVYLDEDGELIDDL